jgi:hypothetical protein
VALALAVAIPAFAQTPNFSGTWTLDAEATAAANPEAGGGGGGGRGGRGGGGGPMTIKQTADMLTIERTFNEQTRTTTYKFDGSAVENAGGGRGGPATYKSKWEGGKLVTEITRQGQDGPVTTSETISLEGGNLVIATKTQRGERKQVYKKG